MAYLFTKSKMFMPVREKIKHPFWREVKLCPSCASVWAALVVYVIYFINFEAGNILSILTVPYLVSYLIEKK